MRATAIQVAAALADPTRESIVRLLVDGERTVGEIAERVPVSLADGPQPGGAPEPAEATEEAAF